MFCKEGPIGKSFPTMTHMLPSVFVSCCQSSWGMKNVFETQTRVDQTLHLKRFISTKKHVNANSGDEVMKKLEKRDVAENF